MSCQRAQEFLANIDLVITEQVNASKEKLDGKAALALARKARTVWVAQGKKTLHFDMTSNSPSDSDLLAVLLGRSGTLRAPTIVAGPTMLVGFNAEVLQKLLGTG